jgi:hypothetical protein
VKEKDINRNACSGQGKYQGKNAESPEQNLKLNHSHQSA